MATRRTEKKENETEELRKNKLEWAVFAVSLLMVLGILSYLVYRSATGTTSSPDLQVSYTKDPAPHNPFRYRIMVENLGEETAEDVIVEATLVKDGAEMERSELQIMFAPKLARREGWVNFRNNPAAADEITVRIASYKKP